MHLGTPALLQFACLRPADEPLVLATIVGTGGSTYRKRGAMMLIARDGAYEGLVSGGCLEGDLLEHAARVFDSGEPASVTYDLAAGDDLVWNLGIGCDGVIHLRKLPTLTPAPPRDGREPRSPGGLENSLRSRHDPHRPG